jgi:hypothetical protein
MEKTSVRVALSKNNEQAQYKTYNTQKKNSNTTQNNKEHRIHNRESCPLQVSKPCVK